MKKSRLVTGKHHRRIEGVLEFVGNLKTINGVNKVKTGKIKGAGLNFNTITIYSEVTGRKNLKLTWGTTQGKQAVSVIPQKDADIGVLIEEIKTLCQNQYPQMRIIDVFNRDKKPTKTEESKMAEEISVASAPLSKRKVQLLKKIAAAYYKLVALCQDGIFHGDVRKIIGWYFFNQLKIVGILSPVKKAVWQLEAVEVEIVKRRKSSEKSSSVSTAPTKKPLKTVSTIIIQLDDKMFTEKKEKEEELKQKLFLGLFLNSAGQLRTADQITLVVLVLQDLAAVAEKVSANYALASDVFKLAKSASV